jgi:thiol-disulfide isomerase/thioredoxin
MRTSRHVALVTGLFALLYSAVAIAASAAAPFSQSAFEAANKAGQPILVEVYAPWCPTCRAQGPILKELRAQARFKGLQAFTVDFDSQKDALKMLKAQSQSTLIVFKGGKEVGRSTGDTRKESIEALLAKAL